MSSCSFQSYPEKVARLKHFPMAPPSVSRERKRRRGREEEGSSFNQDGLGVYGPQQQGVHCQIGFAQEPGVHFFSSPFI
jgi:hypothetical protein